MPGLRKGTITKRGLSRKKNGTSTLGKTASRYVNGSGTSVGARFRELRSAAGLTQQEVAERAGMAQPNVSNIELGNVNPTAEQIKKLERILGSLKEADSVPVEGASGVAEWLNRTRNLVGLSRAQLAEKAGVSQAQVFNIETGRSTSPRKETLQKLERALGRSIPAEFSQEVKEESSLSELKGVGDFIDFDPQSEEDLPAEPGVYVIYDKVERPTYVGQGENIAARIRDHKTRNWFVHHFAANASYVRIPDKILRLGIERLLIKFMKKNAVINEKNVDRG